MNDNVKYIVFAKKEVALLFIFIILVAIISFVIGVKVGKNYSYHAAGYTEEEQARLDLMSTQEELVEKVVKERDEMSPEEDKKMLDKTYKRLEEEFNRLDEQENTPQAKVETEKSPPSKSNAAQAIKEAPKKAKSQINLKSIDEERDTKRPISDKKDLSGKFTIQLGAYRSLDDAQKFADGFRIRGYSPNVYDVELSGRGRWYRVSLGAFETREKAKTYIAKEESLFSGTDYVIKQY